MNPSLWLDPTFCRLIEAALFFHPAVWYLSRRIHAEREQCCDDLVIAGGARPLDYAAAMVRILELSGDGAEPAAAALAATGRRPSLLRRRILRLLGVVPDCDLRLRRGSLAALVAALLAIAIVPWALRAWATAAPPAAKSEAAESAYDHFLYLRHNLEKGSAVTDTLVLAKITPQGLQQRDAFTQNNLHVAWKPVGVVGGRLYAMKLEKLIAIDLGTGKAEGIESWVVRYAYDRGRGRFYALVRRPNQNGLVVRAFDFLNRTERDLAILPEGPSAFGPRQPMAISPDGRRLALFCPMENVFWGPRFRLHVVDLETGSVQTPGPLLGAVRHATGGGDVDEGPPAVWLDAATLLVVHEVSGRAGRDRRPDAGPAGSDLKVAVLDVTTGKLNDLLTLPRWNAELHEPSLRPPGDDGLARILLGELGQYRIDLRSRRLAEDDRIRGDYRFSGGRHVQRLYWHDTQLAQAERIPEFAVSSTGPEWIPDISVSPDGRRLVWLTGREPDAEVRCHDAAANRVRVVARGCFPAFWEKFGNLEATAILWVRAEDLVPREPSRPAAGWKPWAPSPYPPPRPAQSDADPRPNVADLLAFTLSADKKEYKLHEPIALTVTLRNKTDREVHFPRPHENASFFHVSVDSAHLSGIVRGFDRSSEVFPADPVVIQVGGTFQCTKILDTSDLGEHRLEGWVSHGELWQGRLEERPITFTVQRTADEAALLKAKFDRFLGLCRGEFKRDPATCDHFRMCDVLPEATGHLIAVLESSEDPKFCERIGYALAARPSRESLPYFEKLLRGEMKAGRPMVLDGLSNMIRAGVAREEALPLLVSALEHANVEVRRGAADRLKEINDPRVAAGFEKAVAGSDAVTATAAARYLAAREGLNLADWLSRAVEQPTPARHLAARSIVAELEGRWGVARGQYPAEPWSKVHEAPARLAQARSVIVAWQEWARDNPRASEQFFEKDRRPANR